MADDDQPQSIPFEDSALKFAALGGGLWILSRGIFGSRKLNHLKNREKEIQDDIKDEIENPDSFTDAELQTKIETYKNEVRARNRAVPQGVKITDYESQLQGEPLDVRALTWKTLAHRMTVAAIGQQLDQNQLAQFFDASLPDWVQNLLSVGVAATGAAAFVTIIKRLLDFGRGGGGSGGLGSFRNWVSNGIFGSPDIIDDIDSDPEPNERPDTSPTTDPNVAPDIHGSPRGAADDTNIPSSLLARLLALTGLAGAVVITLSGPVVSLIASATSLTVEDAKTHPEKFIILAIAIAAGVILAAGDGPAPVGDAAGLALVTLTAGAIGVTVKTHKLRSIEDRVKDDVMDDSGGAV